MPPRLLPTPQSSKYVEEFLAQPVDAFGRGAQNAQFAAQLANALAAGFAGYQDRKRKRAGQDALTEAIVASQAPSGWVNPDEQWVPPEGLVDVSPVGPGGYLPQEEAALGFRQTIAGDVIPESQRGAPDYRLATDLARQVTPFRPEAAMLEDKTQVRGRDSILNALLTDERLRDLEPEDITLAQKMTLDEMMQRKPRILTAAELKQFNYAPDAVVQVSPDGTHSVIQEPIKPTETFQQMSSEQLHNTFPETFSAAFVEENAGKMWNYSDKNKKVTALGGAGQTINVGGDKNYFTKKYEEGVAVTAETALEKARILGESSETLSQMLAFFDDPEFGTGKMEEYMLPLQQWGRSLGLDIEEKEIATREAFQAKAKQLVLKQVEFMKGALSNKELNFLEEQVAGLGKTPGGNKLILWLGKSTAAKAAAFARYARDWRSDEGKRFYKVGAEGWNDMMADWEKSETYTMTPKEYIMELAETDEELWRSEKVPEDEIANRLENRYSLSLFGQVFKDY